jgi:hypothetical protein
MNTRSLYLPDLMREGIKTTTAIRYDLTDGEGASVVGAAHVAAPEHVEAIQKHLETTEIKGTRVPDTWIESSDDPPHLQRQLDRERSLLYVISALNDYTDIGREEIVAWLDDELGEDLLTVEVGTR